MHPQRTSTALRQLDDLGHEPPPPRWHWAVAKLQPIGRIALPVPACQALGWLPGVTVEVRGLSRRLALVLRRDGAGAVLSVDGRGRLYLPVGMRRTDAVLIGTQIDRSLVIVAPVEVLDGIGDLLVGDRR
jgi:bifunctional DNA-binding transcriptional regulator/antitoxin component of YhaV-PrlF toxin-antitoxin module